MTGVYAGSWNPKQRAVHHEDLLSYLKDSRMKALLGEDQDWILISVGSDKQVSEALTRFEAKMREAQ